MQFEQPPELNRHVDPTIPLTWAVRWKASKALLPLSAFCSLLLAERFALELWLNNRSLISELPLLLVFLVLPVPLVLLVFEVQMRVAHRTRRRIELDSKWVSIRPAKHTRIAWNQMTTWRVEPLPSTPGLSRLTLEYSPDKGRKMHRQWSMVLRRADQESAFVSELEHFRQRGQNLAQLVLSAEPAVPERPHRRLRSMVAVALGFYLLVHGLPLLLGGLLPSSGTANEARSSRLTEAHTNLKRVATEHFASRAAFHRFLLVAGGSLTILGATLFFWGLSAPDKSDSRATGESPGSSGKDPGTPMQPARKRVEMNSRFSSWFKKHVRLPSERYAPSPFARRVEKVIQVLILLAFCTFVLWRLLLYSDVARQIARIRSAGLPVSGAELNSWRRSVPAAENGALVLTQAFALVRTFPDTRSNEVTDPKILSRTNLWTPATRALVEAYIQTNQPALAKVQESLLFSRFRYPADFSYGPETELPHLGSLKEIARILALKAALDAEASHSDSWPEDIELTLRLARTLDDEPTLLPHLARNAIIRTAVKATERGLNRAAPDNEQCKRLQEAFTRVGGTNLLPMAILGDRALLIPVFRLSREEIQGLDHSNEAAAQPRKPQRYSGKPMMFLWLTGLFERDLNFFLKTIDRSASLAALPAPQNLALTNYLATASRVAEKRAYFLTDLLLPAYSKLIVREASTQSLINLSIAALAVERFRLSQGRLPATLNELIPQFLDTVPVDPFNGAPLRYQRPAAGYVLYSVDADGRDNGAREPPDRRQSTDSSLYDITFTVER